MDRTSVELPMGWDVLTGLMAGVSLLQTGENQFLGTCFAYQGSTHFLTAGHCVGELSAVDVAIQKPDSKGLFKASEICRHPTADVAAILMESTEGKKVSSFNFCVSSYSIGDQFLAFGFPASTFGVNRKKPTPRLFKGHFQRFLDYKSRMSFEYKAGELSVPCPAGLSGGPVFNQAGELFGLVTENLKSYTVVDSVVTVKQDEEVVKEEVLSHVINYGICLMLSDIQDWLDEHIPKGVFRA